MTGHESMNDSEPDWNALQQAGVQRFRMQVNWQKINEAGGGGSSGWKNPWAWQNTYDRYIEKAANNGIAVLPYIYGRKDGTTPYYVVGGSGYSEWLEFVWTVVQRYGDAGSFWASHPGLAQFPIHEWEVWNEPNLPANCPGACNGTTYGQFLVGTSATIHQAQKAIYADTAKVLFGGLYMERWNYPVTSYLAEAGKAAGIASAYDGLSIHPYALGKVGEGHGYSEKAAGVWSNVDSAYNAQIKGIGVAKPLWVTEVGWPVSGTEAATVTEAEQAGLLNETYNWLKANWSTYNIKYAAWYFYRDITDNPTTKWDQHAGLRDVNGYYRSSWYTYETEAGRPLWPLTSSQPAALNFGGKPEFPKQSVFDSPAQGPTREQYWDGSSWTDGELTSTTPAPNTSPSAVNFGSNIEFPKQAVFYAGADKQIWEWYWSGSGSTNSSMPSGQPITPNSSPEALSSGSNPDYPKQWVFYRGEDNQMWQWYWNGTSWANSKLTSNAMAPNTSPTAVNFGTEPDFPWQSVIYAGANHQLWQWYWDGPSNNGNVALPSGQPIADNTSPDLIASGSNAKNPMQWAFYRGADGQVWQWYWNGTSWANSKLTSNAMAPNTSPTAVNFGPEPNSPWQSVIYAGANHQLWQWYWDGPGNTANVALPSGQPIADNTSPYLVASSSTSKNPMQWVFYRGADGQMWQWYWNGTKWSNSVL